MSTRTIPHDDEDDQGGALYEKGYRLELAQALLSSQSSRVFTEGYRLKAEGKAEEAEPLIQESRRLNRKLDNLSIDRMEEIEEVFTTYGHRK